MQVIRNADAPTRQIGDEVRQYFMLESAELIVTHVPVGHTQPLHRHAAVYEATYVLDGEIEVIEGERRERLAPGSFVLFEPHHEFHTVANCGTSVAVTLTFKFAPSATSTHSLFASDK